MKGSDHPMIEYVYRKLSCRSRGRETGRSHQGQKRIETISVMYRSYGWRCRRRICKERWILLSLNQQSAQRRYGGRIPYHEKHYPFHRREKDSEIHRQQDIEKKSDILYVHRGSEDPHLMFVYENHSWRLRLHALHHRTNESQLQEECSYSQKNITIFT